MRRVNALLAVGILALFLVHGILGGFRLLGAGSGAAKAAAWACLALIAAHIVLGAILTAQTLRARRRAGVGYFRQNALFWARRVSGLAVMVLLAFHLTAFGDSTGDHYRLRWFHTGRLVTQLMLAAALAAHILTNIRPLLIALGLPRPRERTGDVLAVLSAVLLFMAAAFIVYYLRWNTI